LQVAPANLFSVESRNRLGCLFVIGHFHKSKAAGPTSVSVRRYVDACDLPERFEQRPQIAFRSLETHVADKQILHSLSLLNSLLRRSRGVSAPSRIQIAWKRRWGTG